MEFAKQSTIKTVLLSVFSIALVFVAFVVFSGCANKPLYNIDFTGGNIIYNGESATVKGATWEKVADEDGFDAVYKLTGTVPYNQFVAEKIYGTHDLNVVLIKFTSDRVTKVSYDKTTDTGFYNILNKGTTNEKVKHQSFSSSDGETAKTTYFFYKQVTNEVATLTMNISFDGTKENEAVYKFIIDPANYTLEAPTATETA